MRRAQLEDPFYVIKADHLPALYYLERAHPRPRRMEWINRGTNSVMRPSTVDMLLRTLFRHPRSPSVRKLHESAGLRVTFGGDADRDRFARSFLEARRHMKSNSARVVTAVFEGSEAAEAAVEQLRHDGIPDGSVSMVWRTSQYLDADYKPTEGHSYLGIASAMAGGGIAGAMLGTAILFIPGVGPVAVAGALTASAFSSVAAFSGIVGATGSGIAKMLTDHDVDGVSATLYEQEIRKGRVFVSVDCVEAKCDPAKIHETLDKAGGKTAGLDSGGLS